MACKRKGISHWNNSQKYIKRRKVESVQNCMGSFLVRYNLTVNLFESRSQLRKVTYTRAKISKYHILETENTSQDLCLKIINTNIRHDRYEENVNFDEIIPIVSPILENFKKQHKRFNYFEELKNKTQEINKKSINQRYKNEIHVNLLKSFFGFLLYKNVPLALFGTWKNFKAVKKTIHRLLETYPEKMPIKHFRKNTTTRKAVRGVLKIEPLLAKLNISKIPWLHPLKDTEKKWIIILKLLHWFLAQYIIKILHKYIVLIPIKRRWVYIRKDVWHQMQYTFINEKVKRGDLISYQGTPKIQDEITFIKKNKLLLSSSGLRLVVMCKAEKESHEVSFILTFLQQLYSTYCSKNRLPSVKGCIRQIEEFKKSNKDQLYYVRCDIKDAFGSIIHDKLLNIIKNVCKENLPIYVRIRESVKKIKKKYVQVSERTHQCLEMKALRNIHAVNKKPQLLNWVKLISKIKKLLLTQKIKLYGQVYLVKTGVLQGLRLSPIFSDIYYHDMCDKLFSEFKSDGLLCRYVDDILYITKNKNYADKFLEIIRNDIPEYNVKFNLNKVQTNVELQFYKPTIVRYLGKNMSI